MRRLCGGYSGEGPRAEERPAGRGAEQQPENGRGLRRRRRGRRGGGGQNRHHPHGHPHHQGLCRLHDRPRRREGPALRPADHGAGPCGRPAAVDAADGAQQRLPLRQRRQRGRAHHLPHRRGRHRRGGQGGPPPGLRPERGGQRESF